LKLDKLIKDNKLVDRLDKLDPDNASGTRNDGINYWKGKKIVTLDDWKKKIGRSDKKAYQKDIQYQRIKKEALQFFPDDYERSLFPLGVPQELMKMAKTWEKQYVQLMQFRNNSKCGRYFCFNCLLCPDKEEDGRNIGISRLVARAMEINNQGVEEQDSNTDTPSTALSYSYPCLVLNRFNCPFDRKEEIKKKNKKKPKHHQQQETNNEEEPNISDIEYLFIVSACSFAVESALIRAIDEKSTVIPINSVEDIYHALTNRETLDKLLEHDLNEEQLKYKDDIVGFFMSIKDDIRIEDLTYHKPTEA
jgi:hypothetical protein